MSLHSSLLFIDYRILHDFIEVSVPVEKAEELLHCKYFEYAHVRNPFSEWTYYFYLAFI